MTTTNGGPTPRELERRVKDVEDDIKTQMVPRNEYRERQQTLDDRHRLQGEWNKAHDDRHLWVARALATLGIGLVATIITLIIRIATTVGVTP